MRYASVGFGEMKGEKGLLGLPVVGRQNETPGAWPSWICTAFSLQAFMILMWWPSPPWYACSATLVLFPIAYSQLSADIHCSLSL